MELELQALVTLAKEIAQYNIPDGSRKINGKYIQSHLHSRLEGIYGFLQEFCMAIFQQSNFCLYQPLSDECRAAIS
uniref:Uncharacterized protein n=1 Tax=Rhizophora mucronata TaxID=61149 RepID=A0A2P2L127_RHIMU